MTTSHMTFRKERGRKEQGQKEQHSGLTVKTASWISVAMMLTCVIYLSIAPGLDMQKNISAPSQNSVSSSSAHYLA